MKKITVNLFLCVVQVSNGFRHTGITNGLVLTSLSRSVPLQRLVVIRYFVLGSSSGCKGYITWRLPEPVVGLLAYFLYSSQGSGLIIGQGFIG